MANTLTPLPDRVLAELSPSSRWILRMSPLVLAHSSSSFLRASVGLEACSSEFASSSLFRLLPSSRSSLCSSGSARKTSLRRHSTGTWREHRTGACEPEAACFFFNSTYACRRDASSLGMQMTGMVTSPKSRGRCCSTGYCAAPPRSVRMTALAPDCWHMRIEATAASREGCCPVKSATSPWSQTKLLPFSRREDAIIASFPLNSLFQRPAATTPHTEKDSSSARSAASKCEVVTGPDPCPPLSLLVASSPSLVASSCTSTCNLVRTTSVCARFLMMMSALM
mmetsp:Transcript_29522/g.94649  ORF Transcript_29522/g.94649 Transcript_29522/m.94649 type:complete len:282 (+) Transcript_29522:973-1818(+)